VVRRAGTSQSDQDFNLIRKEREGMDLILVNLIDGLVYGLLLFMLSAGLTLIFSMMGVLNFAHASFYMLGAYFAYQVSMYLGFWMGLLVAPVLVGVIGAGIERYGLRRVHQYGHVPELIFTFGLALLFEEVVQFFWGKNQMAYEAPEILQFALFSIGQNSVQAYKVFMIFASMAIFGVLLYVLTRTRIGLVIQAALSHPRTVEALGHNVPLVFMGVFGVGTGLAGLAGVIAGPVLGTFPGMAVLLGSIVFVTIVIGGLGSLWGALVASLLIGWMTTFAAASSFRFADILTTLGMEPPEIMSDSMLRDLWTLTMPQIGPILPYILMVVVLVVRPHGLFGKRDA
jgi:branched-chain amino acid transport system permease protein